MLFYSLLLSPQERKRVLEAERQARVEELLMRRKEQEARIEQQRQEKEKAREDAARERARFVVPYIYIYTDSCTGPTLFATVS